MAEAIVYSILKNIASFIADLVQEDVAHEFKAFKSVEQDLKAIAEDLECVTSVLHDAEAKQYTNATMKIWLRDLKTVIYDIDDLLDEVATRALQRNVSKGHVFARLRYYLTLEPLMSRFHVSRKLKDLRLQLERVVAKKTKFGLTDCPIEAPSVERDAFDACGYVHELTIVGRDEAKATVMSRILDLGDELSLSVLPIVGMGGIGKTALAKLVYNDIHQFDIKLWVCVSDKFDIRKILQDILEDATEENTSNYSLKKLVEKLQDVLSDKKFFLVLDDLWEDDIRLWRKLESILTVGRRGSVILITTRMEQVASTTQTVEPYYLDELSDSDCWWIFKNLAFVDGEDERYPSLIEIGKTIVENCRGIPLAVQSLGSLLRGERDEDEWLRIKNMDNLNQLDGRYNRVKQILKLSYDKLPVHLEPYFSHLSLFAKDCVYVPYYHFYSCSALGLLKLHDGSCINHSFLDELFSRSMLQDIEWSFTNRITRFKIHDLVHDLAADILREELVVVNSYSFGVPESSRYLAWGLSVMPDNEFPEELVKGKKARAFIFRFQMRSVSQMFLKGVVSNMPRLRILGLGSSTFEELPSSIRNLIHLRFLDLSGNGLMKSLPSAVCELLNLECLLLNGCKQLKELPAEIYKLTNLRFFSLTTCQRSLVGTKFNRLPSLRHMWFDSCKGLVSLWDSDDVGCLTSLRSLQIVDCPKLKTFPNSMKLLIGLEQLLISNCEELDLESGEGVGGLQSLKTLLIKGIPQLTCLPSGMRSTASSLKYMWISDCEGLGELPSWFSSFASLEKLGILNCHNMFSLPEGICHLKSLQYVWIKNCPHLSRRCTTPDEEYLSQIRHVPEIWLDGCRLTPN